MSEDSYTYNARISTISREIAEAMSVDNLEDATKNADKLIREIIKYKKYIKWQKQLKRKRAK